MSMSKYASLEEFIKERDKALIDMDISWAKEQFGNDVSDQVAIISMHKARYEAITIPDELRQASREYLEGLGMLRLGGEKFSEDGSLPE